ncbi:MAG: sigma-54-dependent Fis family transcriptional regulator [Nitrospiraceae bacterium]|nr:MAG: sigma-54-dependent Fis family transcriptional regulator [Nitrospiraceae bacterium]
MTGKILVIDDEDIVRRSCSRTLSPLGYEVRLTQSSLDGLRMIDEEKFDLVLTDIKMPDMDGIEVLKQVRDKFPETKVIIMTGYQSVENALKSVQLGAFDYIEKPFSPDALISSVSKALGNRKGDQ